MCNIWELIFILLLLTFSSPFRCFLLFLFPSSFFSSFFGADRNEEGHLICRAIMGISFSLFPRKNSHFFSLFLVEYKMLCNFSFFFLLLLLSFCSFTISLDCRSSSTFLSLGGDGGNFPPHTHIHLDILKYLP